MLCGIALGCDLESSVASVSREQPQPLAADMELALVAASGCFFLAAAALASAAAAEIRATGVQVAVVAALTAATPVAAAAVSLLKPQLSLLQFSKCLVHVGQNALPGFCRSMTLPQFRC